MIEHEISITQILIEEPKWATRGREWEHLNILINKNKTYALNSTRHTSVLTAKMTQVNSWRV